MVMMKSERRVIFSVAMICAQVGLAVGVAVRCQGGAEALLPRGLECVREAGAASQQHAA
jgi:hypothetical protein